MSIYVQAFKEAVYGRKLLKTMAKGKVAEYCEKRGLNKDVFETAANKVKETSGEYTKNPFKKIYRFFKEFFAKLRELKDGAKKAKGEMQNKKMADFLERTANRPSIQEFVENAEKPQDVA